MQGSILSALIALVALTLVVVLTQHPTLGSTITNTLKAVVAHAAAPFLPAPHAHTHRPTRAAQASSFQAYYTMCLIKSPRRRGVNPARRYA